jgi:general L-amino acid transport system substrate-binding protein
MKALVGLALSLTIAGAPIHTGSRLDKIQRRGSLGCGVEPVVAGFAGTDAQGRYRGLDIDICRAVAAAIFGAADKVTFVPALSVAAFLGNDDIDVVSRRLTWELQREASLGLLFGPVTFYDGQGFLVARRLGVTDPRQLAGKPICVTGGTNFELTLGDWFEARRLDLKKTVIEAGATFGVVADALAAGRCAAYTADVSDLGAIRSMTPRSGDFDILAEQISKEPLAPLVRQDDPQFFTIVRWTVFALINAEELQVTSQNADMMRNSRDVEVQRLLGVLPGNGKALGLDEGWALHAIKAVGNYGEIFDRNVGRDSPIKLDRGLNRLWNAGGLMYAPPLR